jgi:energy-converting hydrogenase B subunit B
MGLVFNVSWGDYFYNFDVLFTLKGEFMHEYVLYFTLFSLAVGALASLKLSFKKNTANVLVGEGLLAVIVATFIVVVSNYYGISFGETIALLLLVSGPIGTIAFSKIMKKGNTN